jgi:hypothetical protein
MTNETIKPTRAIMRIELPPKTKKQLIDYCAHQGMTQVAVCSRMVEWLFQQTDIVQAAVLGLYPEDIYATLPLMIIKNMAADKKK